MNAGNRSFTGVQVFTFETIIYIMLEKRLEQSFELQFWVHILVQTSQSKQTMRLCLHLYIKTEAKM